MTVGDETNLVTRLRQRLNVFSSSYDGAGGYVGPADMDCQQAATELERLRAVLKEIAEMGDENNEWDAVEKYRDCRCMAGAALGDPYPTDSALTT